MFSGFKNNPQKSCNQRTGGLVLPTTQPQQRPGHQPFVSEPLSNTESGVSFDLPASRKRPRDASEELYALPASRRISISPLPSVPEGMQQYQQQQLNIDFLVAERTKSIKAEMEAERKQQDMLLVRLRHVVLQQKIENKQLKGKVNELQSKLTGKEEEMQWKLIVKEEEMQRKLNAKDELNQNITARCWNLNTENQQMKGELAATRTSLEQALAQLNDINQARGASGVADDAESFCGSNDYGRGNAVSSGGSGGI